MNPYMIFIIRLFLGAFFAVLLSRFFFPQANPAAIAGLGVFLVGMAYVFEYFRRRNTD